MTNSRSTSRLVLGIHAGSHDTAVALLEDYKIRAAVQLERLTRIKGDWSDFPDNCIDEVLSIAGADRKDIDAVAISRRYFPNEFFRHSGPVGKLAQFVRTHIRHKKTRSLSREIRVRHAAHVEDIFDSKAFLTRSGFRDNASILFYNHHEAHALPALFFTDWDEALLVTADGGGDNVNYSHRHFAAGKLTTIYGGDESRYLALPVDSLAQLYAVTTEVLGFKANRHEGKVTGLSAMGQPVRYAQIASQYRVDGNSRIHSNFKHLRSVYSFVRRMADGIHREDMAASVQKVVEDLMLMSVRRLLERFPAKRLGVSGGLFANVRLNRLLAENLPIEEIFVVPPMGDDGLAVGGALAYLLQQDGMERWLSERYRLDDVYLGRDFTGAIDSALGSIAGIIRESGSPVEQTARRLAEGQIGAVYTGRMEYGPRALGARSILASPARRETHDLLNTRLDRTEFMPFAPVIVSQRAADVFEINSVNAYACRFMTITCNVRPNWRERIPAIVHVDGSARPQVIERRVNPLYYDIVIAFERLTGIPVLVNTSFNVHEEPIVNAPAECAKALIDGRIDFVVTDQALYRRAVS
jgi:carbamoyltransferase